MQTEQTFKLEAAQEWEYERMLKRGVYYALFADGLITDRHLARLLERLAKGGAAGC